jgi:ABC-type polysaccharide/polyol phosphate export permease
MTLQSLKNRATTPEGRQQTREDCRILFQLVKNDLKSRYSGSAFGIVWAYIQPLVTILVFWYVYQVGFRNAPVNNVEFILWFIAAFIPWTYYSDGTVTAANVMYEYSYLVKKMRFRVWQLPIIKVFSSLRIHLFFLIFMFGMYMLYGHTPRPAWINTFYYTFYISVILVGNAFLLSSLTVFIKDAGQLVNVIMQIGFWLTPIFWSESTMSPNVLKVLKLNPMYYATTGYRHAMIDGLWFWQRPWTETLYYWGAACVILLIGAAVYRHLREHFTDLL